ncbi:hypothetical protein Mapa_006648 [Marchantia paleacea]|nr:hypothetical protein Mapa_006648 [Marchantia paleacea]
MPARLLISCSSEYQRPGPTLSTCKLAQHVMMSSINGSDVGDGFLTPLNPPVSSKCRQGTSKNTLSRVRLARLNFFRVEISDAPMSSSLSLLTPSNSMTASLLLFIERARANKLGAKTLSSSGHAILSCSLLR